MTDFSGLGSTSRSSPATFSVPQSVPVTPRGAPGRLKGLPSGVQMPSECAQVPSERLQGPLEAAEMAPKELKSSSGALREGQIAYQTPHLSIRIDAESALACILSTSLLPSAVPVDQNQCRERSRLHSEHFAWTKRRTCRSESMPRAFSPAF